MKKSIVLLTFISIIIILISSCSTPLEPKPIDLHYKVIKYNNISIDDRPRGQVIPVEIKLVNYIQGKKIIAGIKLTEVGWFVSESILNTANEIHCYITKFQLEIVLTDLVITERRLQGKYYWGFADEERNEFVAIIK